MTRCVPGKLGMALLNDDWLDNPRLDLADCHEIDVLCAELNCCRTDVYLAVAMVGDSVCDVRRYIGSVLEQRAGERGPTKLGDLPPVWHASRPRGRY